MASRSMLGTRTGDDGDFTGGSLEMNAGVVGGGGAAGADIGWIGYQRQEDSRVVGVPLLLRFSNKSVTTTIQVKVE